MGPVVKIQVYYLPLTDFAIIKIALSLTIFAPVRREKGKKSNYVTAHWLFLCFLENLRLLYFKCLLHQNLMAVNIFIQANRILD